VGDDSTGSERQSCQFFASLAQTAGLCVALRRLGRNFLRPLGLQPSGLPIYAPLQFLSLDVGPTLKLSDSLVGDFHVLSCLRKQQRARIRELQQVWSSLSGFAGDLHRKYRLRRKAIPQRYRLPRKLKLSKAKLRHWRGTRRKGRTGHRNDPGLRGGGSGIHAGRDVGGRALGRSHEQWVQAPWNGSGRRLRCGPKRSARVSDI
jgi:hypothetical protein